MKRVIITSLFLIFSFPLQVRSDDYKCITYISKSGTLQVDQDNKFSNRDWQSALDYILKSGFGSGDVERLPSDQQKFARGMYDSDQKLYETRRVFVGQNLSFHNGIIFFENATDPEFQLMGKLVEVIGGGWSYLCRMTED